MAKAKFLGDICSGESYKNQEGEEKTKWTKVGALFQNEETGKFSLKFLNQWMSVFPKKQNSGIESDEEFERKVKKEKEREELTIEDIPF